MLTLQSTINRFFTEPTRAKSPGTTKVVATFGGIEQDVPKLRGLWAVTLPNGNTVSNSRLGDLIDQIADHGGTVARVSA